MRNPFARALALAVIVLFLGGMMLRSDDMDVRRAIITTAKNAKQSLTSQRPLNEPELYTPVANVKPETNTTNTTNTSATALSPGTTEPIVSHTMTCDYDMERLKTWQQKYELQPKFEYTKRYLQISRQDIQRKSVTKLSQKFLPGKAKVVNVGKTYKPETCPEPLNVPVTKSPYPSTANASDFIFGVSTTYKRFNNPATSSINEWTYWLTDSQGNSNGGKLILMLLDASDAELMDAYERLTKVGIDVDVYQSDPTMEMAVRYLTLVPTLYNHPDRKGRKWIVTCDDDTFFPSFHALTERLEQYDHESPLYIGTFSEDVNNIDRHGSQAFGGAGVFLSVPLAKMVKENYESCKAEDKIKEANSGWGPQGDILLRKCIYENSETRLSLINDLWQLDLWGDPSGFYESGIKPLSLHHYRGGGWHIALPWHYTKIAHICGEDCTLQRFRTADDFVISTGFSVAQYPKGINFDLNQFERTFTAAPEDKGWNLDFKLGPQRQSLRGTGRKLSWDLQESTVNQDGTVTQVYVRKSGDQRWKTDTGAPMSKMDGLIELVWMP
ncbi:glycosyltransferase family 31 protein [Thozetella sp. PMI_491]|nr:glycosyltransferase family 31 protein [Thozetella sp. PMI_491]